MFVELSWKCFRPEQPSCVFDLWCANGDLFGSWLQMLRRMHHQQRCPCHCAIFFFFLIPLSHDNTRYFLFSTFSRFAVRRATNLIMEGFGRRRGGGGGLSQVPSISFAIQAVGDSTNDHTGGKQEKKPLYAFAYTLPLQVRSIIHQKKISTITIQMPTVSIASNPGPHRYRICDRRADPKWLGAGFEATSPVCQWHTTTRLSRPLVAMASSKTHIQCSCSRPFA